MSKNRPLHCFQLPWFDLKMKTYTSLNFSPAEEDCLIDEVSRYPALYDAESRDHKDVSLKLNIWKMISEKLNNKSSKPRETLELEIVSFYKYDQLVFSLY